MNNRNIERIIKETVNKVVEENRIRSVVRSVIKEAVSKMYEANMLTEEDEKDMKRSAVMAMLRDKKYDHADLAYALWHPKDDKEEATYRSKFSKCARGILNFNDKDVTKLYQILRKR